MTLNQQIITIGLVILTLQLCRWVAFWVFPAHRPIPSYVQYLGYADCVLLQISGHFGTILRFSRVYFWVVCDWLALVATQYVFVNFCRDGFVYGVSTKVFCLIIKKVENNPLFYHFNNLSQYYLNTILLNNLSQFFIRF